jgi:hypothetical protein
VTERTSPETAAAAEAFRQRDQRRRDRLDADLAAIRGQLSTRSLEEIAELRAWLDGLQNAPTAERGQVVDLDGTESP